MKFSIIFENSGDEIPFHVVHNQDLTAWYIGKANRENCNQFFNNDGLDREIDQRLNDINFAVCKTNEIYWLLCGENFPQNTILTSDFFPIILFLSSRLVSGRTRRYLWTNVVRLLGTRNKKSKTMLNNRRT